MAWTTPTTWTPTQTVTAALLNSNIRDNLLETAVAKAATAGGYFVATGANALAQRTVSSAYDSGIDTTTGTSYGDLAGGASPAVTSTTGTSAIIFLSANMFVNTAGILAAMSFDVSGATTASADDGKAVRHTSAAINAAMAASVVVPVTLTAGSNTFTAKYKVSGGTGTFSVRRIIAFPL